MMELNIAKQSRDEVTFPSLFEITNLKGCNEKQPDVRSLQRIIRTTLQFLLQEICSSQ